MPTLYYSNYSGWTRSKDSAIKATIKGTKEDGGSIEEDVEQHSIGPVTLASLINTLNEGWPNEYHKGAKMVVATIVNGRRIK